MVFDDEQRVVTSSRVIKAPVDQVFELIADPARQVEWEGNNDLQHAAPGQRIRQAGGVFVSTTTRGVERENHVSEFEEGRRIAWMPGVVGEGPAGHVWRWEVEPTPEGHTLATHTYDWTGLQPHDEHRLARARTTNKSYLDRSLDRLAETAELLAIQRMGGL